MAYTWLEKNDRTLRYVPHPKSPTGGKKKKISNGKIQKYRGLSRWNFFFIISTDNRDDVKGNYGVGMGMTKINRRNIINLVMARCAILITDASNISHALSLSLECCTGCSVKMLALSKKMCFYDFFKDHPVPSQKILRQKSSPLLLFLLLLFLLFLFLIS